MLEITGKQSHVTEGDDHLQEVVEWVVNWLFDLFHFLFVDVLLGLFGTVLFAILLCLFGSFGGPLLDVRNYGLSQHSPNLIDHEKCAKI